MFLTYICASFSWVCLQQIITDKSQRLYQMLPNVSAIYRDLAFMANPQADRSYPGGEFSPSRQTAVNQKQLRHDQLMEKFRNAKKQSDYMNSQLGQMNSYNNPPSLNVSLSEQYNIPQPYSYQQAANYYPNEYSQRSKAGWRPPNIKYRHIEDFKQPEPLPIFRSNEQDSRQNNNVEQYVYQESGREGRQPKQEKRNNNNKNEPKEQEQQKIAKLDNSENSSSRNWVSRESKFEDKLESYYDLCRRRPASSKRQVQAVPASKAKFTRGEGKPYQVMQLEKALKVLSFD